MTWTMGFWQGVAATVTAGIILKVLGKAFRYIANRRGKANSAKDVVAMIDNSISDDIDDNSISHD